MVPKKRQGVTVLEFLLVLPLLIMMILAVVELGLLISNRQALEMATRAGAMYAAEDALLPTNGNVPDDIVDVIGRELTCLGIDIDQAIADGALTVRLEHNVGNSDVDDLDPSAVLVTGTLVCPPTAPPPPPDPDLSQYGRRYVRLSVCVRSDLLAPNLLKTYCFDLTTRVTQHNKTYRYELQ